jgi:hypothetical protein
MFASPMSSPKMTRIFGRCADAADCACAPRIATTDPSAEPAASVVPLRRRLRRLRP